MILMIQDAQSSPIVVRLAQQYVAGRLGLSRRAAGELLAAARALGCVADEFSGDSLVRFLRHLVDRGYSPATVNSRRQQLLTVWAWAHRRGLCREPPGEIPRAREVHRVPEAWTTGEVSRLLRAAAGWPGAVGDWPARDWWPALLLTVYWTGARIGAVMAARACDYDPRDGWLLLRHTKNGREQLCRLHRQAIAVVNRIYRSGSGPLFAWPHHRRWLFRVFREIVAAAGVRNDPAGHCQLFHRLRRTTVSYCAAVDPGLAQRQAGHSSYATTLAHYVDPTIAGQRSAADVLPVPQF